MSGYPDSSFTQPLEVFDYVMNLNARRLTSAPFYVQSYLVIRVQNFRSRSGFSNLFKIT